MGNDHERRMRLAVAALLAAALTVACGSTVPTGAEVGLTSGGATAAVGGDGLEASQGMDPVDAAGDGLAMGGAQAAPEGSLAGPSGTAAVSGGGTAAPSAVSGGQTATAPGGGAGGGGGKSTGAGSPQRSAHGPGVSSSELLVGIPYASDPGAGNEAVGATGISYGDPRAQWEAVVDEVNDRGGVAGRRLKPVFYEYKQAQGSGDSNEQAACAALTQDVHVFAVFAPGGDSAKACYDRAGVLALSGYQATGRADSKTFQKFPAYFIIGEPGLDRGMQTTALGLHAAGFFDKKGPLGAKPVIGSVTYDEPEFVRSSAAMDRALRTVGLKVDRQVRVSYPDSESSVGALSAQMSSAVLQFKRANVTHVLFNDDQGGTQFFFFSQAAEPQGYRPWYGLNSGSSPGAAGAPNIDPDQLATISGVGWLPAFDVAEAQADRPPPALRDCVQLFKERGITFSDRTGLAVAAQRCDLAMFLKQAVDTAGPVINRATVTASIERFGASFPSAQTWRTQFSRKRHAGAAAYRTLIWDEKCSCFRFTSGLQAF